MGLDFAFRFTNREPDDSAVTDDDVLVAWRLQVPAAAGIDDVPPALRDVIRRSLATTRLAGTADPLLQLHSHFCDQWGRAGWLHDPFIERGLHARGVRPFIDLVPGPTGLWHDASLFLGAASETISLVRATPALVNDVEHAIAGLTCLEHLFARAAGERRDAQFLVLP